MPGDLSSLTPNQTIADILLADNLLTKEDYDQVKVTSASKGVSEEIVIESMNKVPPAKLAEAKAKMLNIPFIDLSGTSFSPQALAFISRPVAERFSVIPFAYDETEKTLSVAMSNPVDL
jgi:hypothetical protein